MILYRETFTDKSTIGNLFVDGNFLCYALEPTCRKTEKGPIAIPAGKYEVTLYDSPKNKRIVPLLHDVPGRESIEIHVGNYPENTKGCILPGLSKGPDMVMESRSAFDLVLKSVTRKLAEGRCYIDIIGGHA